MYNQIRNFILQLIPGYCVSDYIYMGIIIFIISGFLYSKKWTPFLITLIFSLVFKSLDFIILNQNASIVIQQFLHIITLPFLITVFYSKRN